MIPVDQNKFGKDIGNCFQASVASILELSLDEVPDFCNLYGDEDWFFKLGEWLTERGLGIISFERPKDDEGWDKSVLKYTAQFQSKIYWIGSGPNINGVAHSVVFLGIEMVHDPNPNNQRTGITRLDDQIFILSARPYL